MLWSESYAKIQQMSPKAAKLASRMLCRDPRVPSHWAFALDVALGGRSKTAGSFTSADLGAIVASRTQAQSEPMVKLDPPQREAWTFAASVRAPVIEDAPQNHASRLRPNDALWDPRTPTPEEGWLLAFSHELRRIAEGSVNSDDIARRAIDRLETDGHRNPLVVAKDEFLAGKVRNLT